MESNWYLRRTAMEKWKARRTYLSLTGWIEAGAGRRRSAFFVGLDLPVGERLRSRTNVGDIRIDAGRDVRPAFRPLAIRKPRGLVIPLCNARLLALPLVGRRS